MMMVIVMSMPMNRSIHQESIVRPSGNSALAWCKVTTQGGRPRGEGGGQGGIWIVLSAIDLCECELLVSISGTFKDSVLVLLQVKSTNTLHQSLFASLVKHLLFYSWIYTFSKNWINHLCDTLFTNHHWRKSEFHQTLNNLSCAAKKGACILIFSFFVSNTINLFHLISFCTPIPQTKSKPPWPLHWYHCHRIRPPSLITSQGDKSDQINITNGGYHLKSPDCS